MALLFRKIRFRRWLLGGLAALLVLAAAVGWALLRPNTGVDYRGELAALLPPNTPVAVSLSDLNGLWDRFEALQVCRDIFGKDGVMSLWERKSESLTKTAERALVRRFIRRWFGESALLALFPVDGLDTPATILLARTEGGFEEDVTELATKLAPRLRSESENVQGVAITLYRGSKPSRSFAYCRFGRVVAVSFYSDSFLPLETLVKRRFATAQGSLADSSLYRTNILSRPAARQGLTLYFNGAEAFEQMETTAETRFASKKKRQADWLFTRQALEPLGVVAGEAGFSDSPFGLEIRLARVDPFVAPALAGSSPHSKPPEGGSTNTENRIPSILPSGTLVCFGGQSPLLGELVRQWTFGLPEGAGVRSSATDLSKRLRHEFGFDLEKELLPLLNGEWALAWTDLRGGIGFPALETVALVQVADPHAAAALLERAYSFHDGLIAESKPTDFPMVARQAVAPAGKSGRVRYSIPLLIPGTIEIGVIGNFLAVGLQAGALERLAEGIDGGGAADSLSQGAPFAVAGLRPGASYPFFAFGNFAGIKTGFDQARNTSELWIKGVRKEANKMNDVVSALAPLKSAGIAVEAAEGRPTAARLFIPLK